MTNKMDKLNERINKRTNSLMDRYSMNKDKIDIVIDFIKANRGIPLEYYLAEVKFRVPESKAPKEVFRNIFVESINAGGKSNLKNIGGSCKRFYELLQNVCKNSEERIDYDMFLSECGKSKSQQTDLFKHLLDYKGMGPKRASLVMKEIYNIQKYTETKIFYNYQLESEAEKLHIPLDSVIAYIINKVFRLKGGEKINPNKYVDFISITTMAKRILEHEFILIEDLWYWGYFNTFGNDKKRTTGFNEDKYYSDKRHYPAEETIKKLKEFTDILQTKM